MVGERAEIPHVRWLSVDVSKVILSATIWAKGDRLYKLFVQTAIPLLGHPSFGFDAMKCLQTVVALQRANPSICFA